MFTIIISFVCFSGGTQKSEYSSLPRPMQSKSGFQGCISSLETNGELIDPNTHALVPSPLVEEGCQGIMLQLLQPLERPIFAITV